jgi:hypothetical protein
MGVFVAPPASDVRKACSYRLHLKATVEVAPGVLPSSGMVGIARAYVWLNCLGVLLVRRRFPGILVGTVASIPGVGSWLGSDSYSIHTAFRFCSVRW